MRSLRSTLAVLSLGCRRSDHATLRAIVPARHHHARRSGDAACCGGHVIRRPWPSPASPPRRGGQAVRGCSPVSMRWSGHTTRPSRQSVISTASRWCCGRCGHAFDASRRQPQPVSPAAADDRRATDHLGRGAAASGDGCVVHWARRRPGRPQSSADLLLPPSPDDLRRQPIWWFHRLGIEAKRAGTLTEVARHHDKLWSVVPWPIRRCRRPACACSRGRSRGRWVRCSVRPAAMPTRSRSATSTCPHIVAWNLAGEPRADDRRMLDLLEPYRGQRGRVANALVHAGRPAPAFGPRRRTLQIQHL